jgi:phosphoribosylanthranilate isomerase
MRVKICGITSVEEARMAIAAGADAVGFLIGLNYRTNDEIPAETAAKVIASLPPFISSVLVTHRKETQWIAETCRKIACNTIQLHGEFPLDEIPHLRRQVPYAKVIKAVHVMDSDSDELAVQAAPWVDGILLDTKTETRIGGTGITHDWTISARIVRHVTKPVILAGGLNPENVNAAVTTVVPYGIDVNSGVEYADGSKSSEKIQAFVRLAREAGRVLPNTAPFLSEPV